MLNKKSLGNEHITELLRLCNEYDDFRKAICKQSVFINGVKTSSIFRIIEKELSEYHITAVLTLCKDDDFRKAICEQSVFSDGKKASPIFRISEKELSEEHITELVRLCNEYDDFKKVIYEQFEFIKEQLRSYTSDTKSKSELLNSPPAKKLKKGKKQTASLEEKKSNSVRSNESKDHRDLILHLRVQKSRTKSETPVDKSSNKQAIKKAKIDLDSIIDNAKRNRQLELFGFYENDVFVGIYAGVFKENKIYFVDKTSFEVSRNNNIFQAEHGIRMERLTATTLPSKFNELCVIRGKLYRKLSSGSVLEEEIEICSFPEEIKQELDKAPNGPPPRKKKKV